jgi:hypothetical protein
MMEALMKAGRELDALVAEKVMGLKVGHAKIKRKESDYGCALFINDATGEDCTGVLFEGKEVAGRYEIPPYSTDIAAAWEVLMTFIKSGCAGSVWGDGHSGYGAMVTSDKGRFEVDCVESAPLAVCLAALKAVGVEVTE